MEMEKEIERCCARAAELRRQGYSCSQSVLMALHDKIGLDERLAARIASAYGSGFAATRGICGAVSILGVAQGMALGCERPEDKATAMKATRVLYDRFKDENGGRTLCSELKGQEGVRPCTDLVLQAVRIFLEENPSLAAAEA